MLLEMPIYLWGLSLFKSIQASGTHILCWIHHIYYPSFQDLDPFL